jgi:hypothetical protein
MTDASGLPTTADELISQVTEADRAIHLISLFLGVERRRVEADRPGAILETLHRLPSHGPLRREKDRRLLRAVRALASQLPSGETRRKRIFYFLEEAEWRARVGAR